MIDERLDEHVRAALTGEPPLGFDPDDVVDRAITQRRRRRAVGATLAATVAAVAASGFVLASGTGDPEVTKVPPAAQTYPPPTCEKPFNHKALLPAVRAVLAERAPDVQFGELRTGLPDDSYISDGFCSGVVEVPLAGGDQITVTLQNQSAWVRGSTEGGTWTLVSETTRPDGTLVREFSTESEPGFPPGRSMTHSRPGDWVAVVFYSEDTELSVEQLTAIVTDPRLTF